MVRMGRWTRSMALVAPAVLGSLAGSPAATTPLEPAPLVAVEGSLQENGDPLTGGPHTNVSLTLFVLPGGDVVESQFSHLDLPLSLVARGPVTAALLGELRRALNAARAGVQQDCFMDSSEIFTTFVTLTVTFDWQITWFGLHGRRNVFRVATDRSLALPSCPDEVVNLIREIFHFRNQFYGLSTTQVLDSLPH